MAQAKKGDTVKVHYTGKLTSGEIFDDSLNRDPLEFCLGEGRLIPGFEQAVTGMEPGQWKTVTIPCDQAYGARQSELVLRVRPDALPAGMTPVVGQQLLISQDDGENVVVSVVSVAADHLILDANHPLAGKDLIFEIRLVEIVTAA